MPRVPKPYVKDGWYVTSAGGVQHRKLCRVEDGQVRANAELERLLEPRREPAHPVRLLYKLVAHAARHDHEGSARTFAQLHRLLTGSPPDEQDVRRRLTQAGLELQEK